MDDFSRVPGVIFVVVIRSLLCGVARRLAASFRENEDLERRCADAKLIVQHLEESLHAEKVSKSLIN